MFSRRHPLLFFFLVFSGISAVTLIIVSLVISFTVRNSMLSDYGEPDGEKVGVIKILGVIEDAEETLQIIKRFREDDEIKAIVLRIDSPGGTVGPAQEIYREVQKTRTTKKVIASMGTLAASGGYYAAACADGIIANPGTITGSIGVIMGFTDFSALMEKIGLKPIIIKSGAYKDVGSPLREMTPEERFFLEEFSRKIHQQFMEDVAEGRQMDSTLVADLADGRIFTGEEAMQLGLVDRLGNLEDAIEWAGELGGIEGRIIPVFAPQEPLPFMQYLTESTNRWLRSLVQERSISAEYRYQPN